MPNAILEIKLKSRNLTLLKVDAYHAMLLLLLGSHFNMDMDTVDLYVDGRLQIPPPKEDY